MPVWIRPCLVALLLLVAGPWALAEVTITTLTSLHHNELQGVEDEQPAGWPRVSLPLSSPLLTQTEIGPFLLALTESGTGSDGNNLLRAATIPGHYQVEDIADRLSIPLTPVTSIREDGSTLTANSNHRFVGNLVQRNQGDVIGIIAPARGIQATANSYQFTTELVTSGPLQGGALFKTEADGAFAELLTGSVGALHFPIGFLLHDPATDRVYGVDEGPSGHGRIFQLNADNQLATLYEFLPAENGLPQLPNGLILGTDGWIYGLLGYDRGMPYAPGTLTAAATQVGAIYKLNPADPAATFAILHRFTLDQGEINVANPARYYWAHGSTGVRTTVPVLSHLVEGPDGWLYGGTSVAHCEIWFDRSFWGDARAMSAPLCSRSISMGDRLRYYVYEGNSRYVFNDNAYPDYPDDVVFWPYGIAEPFYDGPRPYGALYRVNATTGEFQLLHEFSNTDGATPRGPLALGPDGRIYGTTLNGGELEAFKKSNGQPTQVHNGVLYRINPDAITLEEGQISQSGFELLHAFVFNQQGNTPTGLVRGADDRLYGATFYGGQAFTGTNLASHDYDDKGTLFVVDTAGTAATGSILLTLNPAISELGQLVEITWSGHQVAACQASSTLAEWSGPVETSGSLEVSPPAGTYYLSLACQDQATGRTLSDSATLRVDMEAETSSGHKVDYGNGSFFSLLILLPSGLLALLGWRCRQSRGGCRPVDVSFMAFNKNDSC